MPSTHDLDNRALRHLREAKDEAARSCLTLRQKCRLACLMGVLGAGLLMLAASIWA